jgi:hypothetical protein
VTDAGIWTLRDIAKALGVADRGTVIAFAQRRFDPLRLRCLIDEYWIRRSVLDMWKARQIDGADLPRVVGLEAIGKLTRRSINGVKALARRPFDPLPIYGLGKRHPWSYACALDDWIDAQDRPFQSRAEPDDPARLTDAALLSGETALDAMSNPARLTDAFARERGTLR